MALPPNTQPPSVRSNGALAGQMRGILSNVQRMGNQPGVRRSLPAIMIVSLTVLALGGWVMLREPSRVTLYPGLPEAEKSQVITTLTEAGISAVIDNRTGDVAVPGADYQRARMLLAAQGLPQGMPDGNALLADMPMGTSRSVETARLRQAQELDLARSITEIAAISAAQVHLALPERSAFIRDSLPPRASVFLQVAPGRVLDPAQVEAIVNLVSSSVSGMSAQEVTVVDQMGRLLSRGAADAVSLLNDRQLQHRIQLETLYRNRIETLLTPLAGPGNLAVQVTIDMDFTREEITAETVDPNGSALLSEQSQTDESADPAARGIPGAVSNTAPAQPTLSATAPPTQAEGAAAVQTNKTASSTRNFEVSRRTQTTQPQTARILRISAAVLMRAEPADDAEAGAPLLPAPFMADVERLAQSAIGFDAKRGDSVTVMAQPFLDTLEVPTASWTDSAWLPGVAQQFVTLAAIAIIALGVVRPMLNRVLMPAGAGTGVAATSLSGAVEVGEGETLDDVRARLEAHRLKLSGAALGAGATQEEKFAVLRQIAGEDPARIATLFQRMMRDDLEKIG